ncbi:argininosuccinate lyase [Roseovarius sp. PS-C2]|uniref:argininosuccinate lyase n=1 Tax=Roseovarius sp. PS-C2 TaxID=2820814 RepID=UPI001C0C6638|nr:argininosuccinate lyase [Roseovarius sp. PS-C2]MBU3260061.1 argininosuccinate lyase [Roseovarius sp. PS-C2]
MTRIFAALMLAALAGCGADGEPIRPTAQANVGVGSHGVSGSVGTTLRRGNVSVGMGVAL